MISTGVKPTLSQSRLLLFHLETTSSYDRVKIMTQLEHHLRHHLYTPSLAAVEVKHIAQVQQSQSDIDTATQSLGIYLYTLLPLVRGD
jgi:hypothetical protein